MFTQEDYQIIHELVSKASKDTHQHLITEKFQKEEHDAVVKFGLTQYLPKGYKIPRVEEEKLEYQYKLDRLLMKLAKELK